MLTNGVIAYFYDEFMSSWTAWLGVILICSTIVIEKSFFDMLSLIGKKFKTQKESQVASFVDEDTASSARGTNQRLLLH